MQTISPDPDTNSGNITFRSPRKNYGDEDSPSPSFVGQHLITNQSESPIASDFKSKGMFDDLSHANLH